MISETYKDSKSQSILIYLTSKCQSIHELIKQYRVGLPIDVQCNKGPEAILVLNH